MPETITLSFSDLVRMADAAPDKSIIVKGGGFKAVGKVGAFFASKAECRQTAQSFLEGITMQYGDAVAFTLAPELRALQASGKPLSARKAKDLLQQAKELSQGLSQVNADMAQKFIAGSGISGDPRTLDKAFADYCGTKGEDTVFADYCESKGLDPQTADRAACLGDLKNSIADAVLMMAKTSGHLMSFAELGDAVRSYDSMADIIIAREACDTLNDLAETYGLTAEQKAGLEQVATMSVRAGLPSGAHVKARALADKLQSELFVQCFLLGEAHGLSAEQKVGLEQVAAMSLRHAEHSLATAAQGALADALRGDLTVQCYLYTCGARTLEPRPMAVLRDILDMAAATPHLRDVLCMVPQLGNSYMSVFMAAIQNMPRIRALQPEGIPSRETIWQACFNEKLPGDLTGAKEKDFSVAMLDKLEGFFKAASNNDVSKTISGSMIFGSGIRMEKALASLNGPVSLSLEDFLAPPRLTPLQRLPSLEDCEKKLALDLNRRGSHQSIEGYAPVITFGAAGQDAEMVHIQDLSGLSVQERENFSNGRVSPISHDLVGKARALCGNNEAQLRQVVQGMGQAATIIMRVTSAATGAVQDEHSPIDVDVRRQTNGDVTLRFHTPPSSRLDADYTFTITPDGKGTLTDFRMQARPAGR